MSDEETLSSSEARRLLGGLSASTFLRLRKEHGIEPIQPRRGTADARFRTSDINALLSARPSTELLAPEPPAPGQLLVVGALMGSLAAERERAARLEAALEAQAGETARLQHENGALAERVRRLEAAAQARPWWARLLRR